MNQNEMLWKQRFEKLCIDLQDLGTRLSQEEFEKTEERVWQSFDVIYVSFAMGVCDNEKAAKELFGEGNYDTYRVINRSPKT